MRGDDGALRELFREAMPQLDWQRIESAITGSGIPDLNYCGGGIEGWVECKKTTGWAVTLRPHQVGWLLRRTRAGGRTWVAVRRINRDADCLHLVPGGLARELKDLGLRANLPGALVWGGGPGGWDWTAVRRALLTPWPGGPNNGRPAALTPPLLSRGS